MLSYHPQNQIIEEHYMHLLPASQQNTDEQLKNNSTIERTYYSIINNLIGLFRKLPDKFQSAILIDYSHSPERKALEIHKLLHPVICISLEAEMEDTADHNIYYSINYSFRRKVRALFYKEIMNIINMLTIQAQIQFNVVQIFYSDSEIDEIARYKLIGANDYITITEQGN
jgi:hypothetical protein